MKTLSGTFARVVLGLIVIVAVVSCCCVFPLIPNTTSFAVVEIGNKQKGPKYAKWKSKGQFHDALAQVRGNPKGNGKVCICVLESSQGTPYKHELNNDCPRNYGCPSETIRTVKVTKSKAADDIAAGESAANDPSVMHRVQSSDPGDIKKVLDALEQ